MGQTLTSTLALNCFTNLAGNRACTPSSGMSCPSLSLVGEGGEEEEEDGDDKVDDGGGTGSFNPARAISTNVSVLFGGEKHIIR